MFKEIKKDEDGHVVLNDDGLPIYIDKDDKEVPVDASQMYQKILDLGKESKTHREKNKELVTTLGIFEGIDDIGEWKKEADKALETVQNFNDKDWMKAEKVDSLKRQMKEAHETEITSLRENYDSTLAERDAVIVQKDAQIRSLLVSAKFAASPYFSGEKPKTILPPDVAESYFGKHFKVEANEKTGELIVRAYYANGDLVYSRKNPGEPADFEEGISEVFEAYPGKDKLIRPAQAGSGAGGGGGEGEPTDDLAELQKQYDEAVAAKNTTRAIAIKNRMHELRMAQKSNAA